MSFCYRSCGRSLPRCPAIKNTHAFSINALYPVQTLLLYSPESSHSAYSAWVHFLLIASFNLFLNASSLFFHDCVNFIFAYLSPLLLFLSAFHIKLQQWPFLHVSWIILWIFYEEFYFPLHHLSNMEVWWIVTSIFLNMLLWIFKTPWILYLALTSSSSHVHLHK